MDPAEHRRHLEMRRQVGFARVPAWPRRILQPHLLLKLPGDSESLNRAKPGDPVGPVRVLEPARRRPVASHEVPDPPRDHDSLYAGPEAVNTRNLDRSSDVLRRPNLLGQKLSETKKGPAADATGPSVFPDFRTPGPLDPRTARVLVHPAHPATGAAALWGVGLRFRNVGDHRFGRQQQGRDGRSTRRSDGTATVPQSRRRQGRTVLAHSGDRHRPRLTSAGCWARQDTGLELPGCRSQ